MSWLELGYIEETIYYVYFQVYLNEFQFCNSCENMINILKKDSKLKDRIFKDCKIFEDGECCVASDIWRWIEDNRGNSDEECQIFVMKIVQQEFKKICPECKIYWEKRMFCN